VFEDVQLLGKLLGFSVTNINNNSTAIEKLKFVNMK